MSPEHRLALAIDIKERIDGYCETAYDDGHRKHLGASLIGHECSRHLWYVFRWASKEQFTPRMLRLFNRGHREEARFVEWLRGIGWEVSEHDIKTKDQFRISDVMGHFGGSLDGLARSSDEPIHMIEDDADAFLLEFKTSGTGAGFTSSVEKGVRRAKPKHWAQMCVYGFKRRLRYAIYFIINKNDDDFHCEVVELDWKYGEELLDRAQQIITSPTPPERLSQSPSFHICKYCHHKPVCFDGAQMEKNCRTCKHSEPFPNAEWFCAKWFNIIPNDFVASGCDHWEQIV